MRVGLFGQASLSFLLLFQELNSEVGMNEVRLNRLLMLFCLFVFYLPNFSGPPD